MITVRRYTTSDKTAWNTLIRGAKNGLFLFDRNYMDYHADRFADHSLMFYEKNALIAVFPANVSDGRLLSHEGLTFGGVLSDERMTTKCMLEVFAQLLSYAKTHKFRSILYKAIPSIYHTIPAQEDLYALFRNGARLVGRDIASVIHCTNRLPYHTNTKRLIRATKRIHLTISENRQFRSYMGIVSALLKTKYHTKPTHTASEITALASKFPKQIRLFTVNEKTEPLGGVIVYDYPTVAHCQYIAASDRGKMLSVLNPLFHELISGVFSSKRYFSFGRSTERLGTYLNEGLIQNKERYGGRGVVHDTYELPVKK